MRINRLLIALLLTAGALTGAAGAQTVLEGPLVQGGLVIGQTDPGAEIVFNGAPLMVSPAGKFLFGFDRDHDGPATLAITSPGGQVEERSLKVEKRAYNIQRIDGLPPKYVSPPAEELPRIKQEGRQKRAARAFRTAEEWFASGFAWPAYGRISGVFGSQRFYNGEPRRPHYGVDVAGPAGAPVHAPAPGIVRLADANFYFEGGVIFIDHGHGLTSVLMHLGSVEVEEGAQVAQGDLVGTIGATGRATGPHVDWRMYWGKTHVDPAQLVPPMDTAQSP